MKTAIELLEEYGFDESVIGYNGELDDLAECMKEYGKKVAQHALEDAYRNTIGKIGIIGDEQVKLPILETPINTP